MKKLELKVLKNLFRLICGALLMFGSSMAKARTAIAEIEYIPLKLPTLNKE